MAYAFFRLLAPIGRFVAPLWSPLDFEGGPQIDHFIKKKTKIRKMRSKKLLNEKLDLLVDF